MIRSGWMALLFYLMALPAAYAGAIADGPYGMAGGGGILKVQQGRFDISATGSNGHSCTLRGKLEGQTGIADDIAGPPVCRVNFTPSNDAVKVSAESWEACRSACGTRAGFLGDYIRLPATCTPQARQSRRDQALLSYQQKDYVKAYTVLNGVVTECRRFMRWIEEGQLNNDLALMAYRRGRKDECRRLSAQVIDVDMLEQFRQTAPGDYDNYLPLVQAARHNAELCRE